MKTDPAYNLDLARKNATRCAGYLARVDSELVAKLEARG